MQFYLARDLSQIDLGTALYRLRLWKWKNLVSPTSVLEKFKQFDFRPNSGYAFAVGRTSWHGREEVPEASGVRNSLMHLLHIAIQTRAGDGGTRAASCPAASAVAGDGQSDRIRWPYVIGVAGMHLLALLAFVPAFFSWTGVALAVAGLYVFGTLGINSATTAC